MTYFSGRISCLKEVSFFWSVFLIDMLIIMSVGSSANPRNQKRNVSLLNDRCKKETQTSIRHSIRHTKTVSIRHQIYLPFICISFVHM